MGISQVRIKPSEAGQPVRRPRRREARRSSVQRVASLLHTLGHGRPSLGLTLTDLSDATGIPKPTALRLLDALKEAGLVERGADMRFRIGLRLVELGSAYVDDLDLVEQSRSVLQELAAETQETVHLGAPSGRAIVYLHKIESTHSLRMVSRIGSLNPLHTTALGKAILASGDEAYLSAVLAEGLEQRTPNTISDENTLRADLAAVRARGYAVDRQETRLGISCVGAEIKDRRGTIVGAISISGPSVRIDEETLKDLGLKVRQAADEISRRMGHVRVKTHP